VLGRKTEFGYSLPGSRTRGRAIREDLVSTAKELPETARAIKAAVHAAREDRANFRSSAKRSVAGPIQSAAAAITVPSVTVLVDLGEWDQRAAALGGTSNTLLVGIAARMGLRRGRTDADGLVTVNMPVSDRKEGDTRANALAGVSMKVDPEEATTALKKIRADIKSSLVGLSDEQNGLLAALPLTPFMPKRLLRKLEGLALGAGYPVGCTNLGDVDPVFLRPDGTAAEVFFVRSPIEWPVTPQILDKLGGSLVLASVRIGENVVLAANGWQVGAANTEEALVDDLLRAVADFDLKGTWF